MNSEDTIHTDHQEPRERKALMDCAFPELNILACFVPFVLLVPLVVP